MSTSPDVPPINYLLTAGLLTWTIPHWPHQPPHCLWCLCPSPSPYWYRQSTRMPATAVERGVHLTGCHPACASLLLGCCQRRDGWIKSQVRQLDGKGCSFKEAVNPFPSSPALAGASCSEKYKSVAFSAPPSFPFLSQLLWVSSHPFLPQRSQGVRKELVFQPWFFPCRKSLGGKHAPGTVWNGFISITTLFHRH